jgi:hypothetical protein
MAAGNLILCPNIRENARLPDWQRSALVGYFPIILAFGVLSTWSVLLSPEENNLGFDCECETHSFAYCEKETRHEKYLDLRGSASLAPCWTPVTTGALDAMPIQHETVVASLPDTAPSISQSRRID